MVKQDSEGAKKKKKERKRQKEDKEQTATYLAGQRTHWHSGPSHLASTSTALDCKCRLVSPGLPVLPGSQGRWWYRHGSQVIIASAVDSEMRYSISQGCIRGISTRDDYCIY